MASADMTTAFPALLTIGDSVIMVDVGLAHLLARKESRGSQFRNDIPEAREESAHRSTLTNDDIKTISEGPSTVEPHTGNSNVIQMVFAQ